MKSTNLISREISVIGLGAMGSTLARLLLRSGYRVTVWNRSIARAKALVEEGAVLASDVAAAIHASPIIVICVHDYKATHSILDTAAVAAALSGKVLLQLTTGSPKEAKDSEAWARERGAAHLDGAIQATPSQMGRPDTFILVSGMEPVFRQCEPVLKVFGGNIVYLGSAVEAASAMDLATLSYLYGAVLGFVQGAHMAEASGIGVDTYSSLVADLTPTFGEFLKHEGNVIQSGNYTVSESPLKISVEATERILQQAREARLNTEFPALAASLLKRAALAGYEQEELAALIKVLREKTDQPTTVA